MRNLNGRFLILVGEDGHKWSEAASRLLRGRQCGSSRVASNENTATSRNGAILCPQVSHADGGCLLRFLDFDAGELAWSVACPTGAADEADSLERSRMTTFCTR